MQASTVEIPKLTKKRALELLAEAVAERGKDYVYRAANPRIKGCRYVSNGKPSCLVGLALHKHGVGLRTLAAFDARTDGQTVGYVLEGAGWVSPSALRTLEGAQGAQDTGQTWGEALAVAKRA